MIPKLTEKEARELIARGNVVFPHLRKGEVSVDGFKRYSASPSLCKLIKELNASR